MTNALSEGVFGFFDRIGLFWQSASAPARLPFIILDILIVAALFYFIYVLIRETHAWRILLGLLILFIFYLVSRLLGLTVVAWIFKNFFAVFIVAIPVVFQPELRGALERLGRIKLSEFPKEANLDRIIDILTNAPDILSKSKTGALLIIQRKDGLKEYIETGTKLNADLSTPLLLNIFQKNSPFHDGAVVIVGNKIIAASCLVPIRERYVKQSGMRHQAGIAAAKETDALIIIVSEETGEISVMSEGKIKKELTRFDLRKVLLEELKGEKKEKEV